MARSLSSSRSLQFSWAWICFSCPQSCCWPSSVDPAVSPSRPCAPRLPSFPPALSSWSSEGSRTVRHSARKRRPDTAGACGAQLRHPLGPFAVAALWLGSSSLFVPCPSDLDASQQCCRASHKTSLSWSLADDFSGPSGSFAEARCPSRGFIPVGDGASAGSLCHFCYF